MEEKKQVEQKEKLGFWKTLKALWGNTRYRAMIRLGGYLVFVIFVLIMIQSNTSRSLPTSQNSYYRLANMNNYEYQYTFTVNQTMNVVKGIHVSDKESFEIVGDSNKYLLEGELYYQLSNNGKVQIQNPVSYSLPSIQPHNLEEMLDASQKISTTNYETGETEKVYQLSSEVFYSIWDSSQIKKGENITIKVKESNNVIASITIDMTAVEQKANPTITKCELVLEYFHIGEMRVI